jgi:hypothetical protein
MKKSLYVFAILAATISTSAMAKDLKQDKKATTNAPALSAAQMSDAEMDKVTAGDAGFGLSTACCESVNASFGVGHAPVEAGLGRTTASGVGNTPF